MDTLGELATALQENESVTDALNTAIGTKANASEVVKLSGNQTIAGTKTFSSTISGSISGNAATATKATQDASGNVITSTYATKSELTSGLSGKVQSVNGVKPDSSGNVSIAVGSDYTLPTASANTLGGVKIGSNITNNSGTISVSQKNVTDALGYTPLQNAPVTSVDGKTGAIDLSSTYQPKGNYLTSAPVSSVNGQTGAVTIDTGVTSFNGFKGAVTYTAPVTSVNGKTGAVNIDVGVKTVNGTAPDSSGNVTIEVSGGGGSGDGIPKTGNRGTLAGYESFDSGIDWEGVMDGSSMPPTITINDNSPDVSFAAMDVIVENGSGNRFMDFMVEVSLGLDVGAPPLSHSTAWTKCVFLMGGCIVEIFILKIDG